MTQRIAQLVDSKPFKRVVLILILFAAVLVGLETSESMMERNGDLLKLLDRIVLWAFAVEALLKMAAHGRRWYRYFLDPWNIFDFVIVVVCFLPVNSQYAAVLRLARVLRTLRLVSGIPKLQLLVGSLLHSLPAMVYVGALLGIMFYVYAVLGVFLFRENDPVHFRDLGKALLTLFRVVTLEDWTDVMYIQMYGSDTYDFSPQDRARFEFESVGRPLVGAFYFVSFVLFGTMIMLNLFIGVVIKSMEEAEDEQNRAQREKSLDADGHLTDSEELVLLEERLQKIMSQVRSVRHEAEKREKREAKQERKERPD
ncbi:MAG: ion transporter [Planctomycetota bacterium]